MLFDLVNDPKENTNIHSEKPELSDSLFELIKEHMSVEQKGAKPPSLTPAEIETLKSLGYL